MVAASPKSAVAWQNNFINVATDNNWMVDRAMRRIFNGGIRPTLNNQLLQDSNED